MTEVQQATTLEDLTRDPGAYALPVMVEEHDAVVLGYGNDGWIEVCRDNVIGSFMPRTAVIPLADPARQAAALRSALLAVAGKHASTLDGIRSYAIERYQDGSICHTGLNEFLRAFDLGEHED